MVLTQRTFLLLNILPPRSPSWHPSKPGPFHLRNQLMGCCLGFAPCRSWVGALLGSCFPFFLEAPGNKNLRPGRVPPRPLSARLGVPVPDPLRDPSLVRNETGLSDCGFGFSIRFLKVSSSSFRSKGQKRENLIQHPAP